MPKVNREKAAIKAAEEAAKRAQKQRKAVIAALRSCVLNDTTRQNLMHMHVITHNLCRAVVASDGHRLCVAPLSVVTSVLPPDDVRQSWCWSDRAEFYSLPADLTAPRVEHYLSTRGSTEVTNIDLPLVERMPHAKSVAMSFAHDRSNGVELWFVATNARTAMLRSSVRFTLNLDYLIEASRLSQVLGFPTLRYGGTADAVWFEFPRSVDMLIMPRQP